MSEILVPIFVCVVLPVAIVAIVFIAEIINDNNRSKVLIKAIDSNSGIDVDKLAGALQKSNKPRKTSREILNLRLLRGCIFSFIGMALCTIALIILYKGTGFLEFPVIGPLIFGSASLGIGISYLIVYFVTRKQIKD